MNLQLYKNKKWSSLVAQWVKVPAQGTAVAQVQSVVQDHPHAESMAKKKKEKKNKKLCLGISLENPGDDLYVVRVLDD